MYQRWNTRFHQHWMLFFLALIWIGMAGVRLKLLASYWRELVALREMSGELMGLTHAVEALEREVLLYLIVGIFCLLSNGAILGYHRFIGSSAVEYTVVPPQHRWRDFLLLLSGFYLISFGLFYSVDGSFTRLLSTTPYCYPHPIFRIYQPLVRLAWSAGWHGGGEFVEWMGF